MRFLLVALLASCAPSVNSIPLTDRHRHMEEVMGLQSNIQIESGFPLPEFLSRYHIFPIVDENGKMRWTYDPNDANAKKPWIGNPNDIANFHLDFQKFHLDAIGITPDRINKFVSRAEEPTQSQPPELQENANHSNLTPTTELSGVVQSNIQTSVSKPINIDGSQLSERESEHISGGPLMSKLTGMFDRLVKVRKQKLSTANSEEGIPREEEPEPLNQQKLSEMDVDFYSDLSKEKLEYGRWFHRAGADFDINDVEWSNLSPADKKQFFLVSTPEDKMRVINQKVLVNVESSPIRLPPLGKDGKARTPGFSDDKIQTSGDKSPKSPVVKPLDDSEKESEQTETPSEKSQVSSNVDLNNKSEGSLDNAQTIKTQPNTQPNTVVYQTNVYTSSSRPEQPITVTEQGLDMKSLVVQNDRVSFSQPVVQAQPQYLSPYGAPSQIPSQYPVQPYQPQAFPPQYSSPIVTPQYPQQFANPQFTQQYAPQQFTASPYIPQEISTQQAPTSTPTIPSNGIVQPAKINLRQDSTNVGEQSQQSVSTESEDTKSAPASNDGMETRKSSLQKPTAHPVSQNQKEFEKMVASEPTYAIEDNEEGPVQFFSDLSNKPLEYGKWYHKLGSDFDITAEEYTKKIKPEDKDKFVLIKSEKDHLVVERAAERTGHLSSLSQQPLHYKHWYHKKGFDFDITDTELKTQIPVNERDQYILIRNKEDKVKVKLDSMELNRSVFSDISNTPLEYGHWYHKIGSNFDITDSEFESMVPATERGKYVLVQSKEDRLMIENAPVISQSGPVILNAATEPVSSPSSKISQSDNAPTLPEHAHPTLKETLIETPTKNIEHEPTETVTKPRIEPEPKKRVAPFKKTVEWNKAVKEKENLEKMNDRIQVSKDGALSFKPSRILPPPKFRATKAGVVNVLATKAVKGSH